MKEEKSDKVQKKPWGFFMYILGFLYKKKIDLFWW